MAKKKNRKPSFLRLLGTAVLVCLLAYFSYMYINQGIVLSRQNEQIERMETENARIEEEYQAMLQQVEDKNTLEYIDKYTVASD
jgi:cell division protein FtsB